MCKESTCNPRDAGDVGSIAGSVRSLEEGMAAHSSVLAWRIPWTEEPGGLQSMWSQTVKHDWSDLAHMQFQHMVIIWCFLIYRFIPTSFFVCCCWQIHPLFCRVPHVLIFMFESNGVIYRIPLLPVSLPVPLSRSRESFWLIVAHSPVCF